MAKLPDTAFWRVFDGPMKGILDWARYDEFVARLRGTGGEWYVFDLTAAPPTAPVDEAEFAAALSQADALIRAVRNRPWLGAVYADDLDHPGFVKIFDPAELGGSCSLPGAKMMPRWIISRMPPDAMTQAGSGNDAKGGLISRLTNGLTGRSNP